MPISANALKHPQSWPKSTSCCGMWPLRCGIKSPPIPSFAHKTSGFSISSRLPHPISSEQRIQQLNLSANLCRILHCHSIQTAYSSLALSLFETAQSGCVSTRDRIDHEQFSSPSASNPESSPRQPICFSPTLLGLICVAGKRLSLVLLGSNGYPLRASFIIFKFTHTIPGPAMLSESINDSRQ